MRGTACRVVRNSMTPRSRRLCGALAAALVVVGSGCSPRAPTTPSAPSSARPPVSTDLVVQGIGPVAGKPAQPTAVRIWGDGFQSGATVTFDGSATSATVESGHYILTTAPPHPAGGGPSNPPLQCPGFGFCWFATSTDNLGAYSVEFETRTWPRGVQLPQRQS
jgi:IPT/TIG domain-containing protein